MRIKISKNILNFNIAVAFNFRNYFKVRFFVMFFFFGVWAVAWSQTFGQLFYVYMDLDLWK